MGRFLFRTREFTSELVVYDFERKIRKTFSIGFEFLDGTASVHVESDCYLAGGCHSNKMSREFRKISHSGEVADLQLMPQGKQWFPIAYCSREPSLFTVGGYC